MASNVDEGVAETNTAAVGYPVVGHAEGQSEASAKATGLVHKRQSGRLGYRFVKRTFDIVFSAVVIIVLFVPAILLCIAIRIETPGNPIYIQKRVGRHTKNGELYVFPMLKFRSMFKDAESQVEQLRGKNEAVGPLFKIKDDPRITKLGRFLRRHSIDEFPQFVNVFLGQMSVCGPRPPLPEEIKHYEAPDFVRLSVKPGATGYWQIRKDEDFSFEAMFNLDLEYIEERSLLVDLKIVAKTIRVVLFGKKLG